MRHRRRVQTHAGKKRGLDFGGMHRLIVFLFSAGSSPPRARLSQKCPGAGTLLHSRLSLQNGIFAPGVCPQPPRLQTRQRTSESCQRVGIDQHGHRSTLQGQQATNRASIFSRFGLLWLSCAKVRNASRKHKQHHRCGQVQDSSLVPCTVASRCSQMEELLPSAPWGHSSRVKTPLAQIHSGCALAIAASNPAGSSST